MYTDSDREYLDDLRLQVGLPSVGPPPRSAYTYDRLAKTQWSADFEFKMRNRLIIGALRYGLLHDPRKPAWDRVTAVQNRLARYAQTRNKELLVDIANLCLLEYEEGYGHFEATDDGEHVQIK